LSRHGKMWGEQQMTRKPSSLKIILQNQGYSKKAAAAICEWYSCTDPARSEPD
jgi:hypothetical protein